jgi:hypothetical protein
VYLSINSNLRPFNEVRVSVSYEPMYDVRRRMIAVSEVWDMSGRIVLQDASQSAMTVALRKLDSDFSAYRPDLRLVEDNGQTPAFMQMLAQDCIEGPYIRASSLPSDPADIYATGMSYQISYVGVKSIVGTGSDALMSFTETLDNPRGGVRMGYIDGAINAPELQIFKQREAYEYVQTGSAVGLYGYPKPAPSLWPQFQIEELRPKYMSPRVIGRVNREFEIQWTYRFQSPYRLQGFPHSI